MTEGLIFFYLIQIFILLLGISIGHSALLLKIRHEENRKRELELALLEKRADILQQGKKIAHDLEEVLYKAKVQQEIDDIIRKDGKH
ncbi:MAG: hypothetical protein GX640_23245 [Fibrobacter sp.]|nr:hypothetical protein [Fibrobacter sp.]